MTMHFCMVDDANGNKFHGLTDNQDHEGKTHDNEDHRPVWAFIDRENGFGADVGSVTMLKLKKADSGYFVA